jgi:FeS assembly protein SufB
MASLLANGTISSLSPQPTYESPKLPKGFHPRLQNPKFPNPKTPTSRLFKVRADVGYSGPSSPSSSPGMSSISTATTTSSSEKIQEILRNVEYDKKFGFNIDIDSFSIPKGLSKETIRLISSLKEEPDWMLEFRLNAYERFLKMKEPKWSDNRYPSVDFQDICYYSAPKKKPTLNSLDEADPELVRYFDKLGVPLNEQNRLANVAVDAVLDSVSIATTHRKTLEKAGVIFCSISEAIREYPDMVRKYLGRVVPSEDNYYAALNSAVFSDGSFCYIPKDTKCPMQISTYFRINALETGQFERTLIVADDRSFVEYLEGCTAPSYDRNQLHAAVVELYCAEDAQIKYSTVQNWYAGDEEGKGGVYNFVTKRGLCAGARSKISWTQVETGSAITWKYPSVVLEGDDTVGEFYSVALTNNYQQADTGTKMIHKGKNTRSRIISKGISTGNSRNCYRGLVQVQSKAENARNSSQCDSMLIGDRAAANTYPYIQVLGLITHTHTSILFNNLFDEVITTYESHRNKLLHIGSDHSGQDVCIIYDFILFCFFISCLKKWR